MTMKLHRRIFDKLILLLRWCKLFLVQVGIHRLFGKSLPRIMLYWAYYLHFSRWCESQSSDRIFLPDRPDLYRSLIIEQELSGPIYYLEFGVATGTSMRYWIEHNRNNDSRFVGFDTFTGLPEDWGFTRKGFFSTNGSVPAVQDARCVFVKGLFQETLASWLASADLNKRLVIHLDADLYSSTAYVLTRLRPYLEPGDILIFDEFNYPLDEFRAFSNFIDATGFSYEVVGLTRDYWQVAMRITACP